MPRFKLSKEEIQPLAVGFGACIASSKITVDGLPVRFMYREKPDNDVDSGWRFFSGLEDPDYLNDADNHAIYDVNTIANYDPSILPLLESPAGSAFEKTPEDEEFVEVEFNPPDDG
jgi:hypothetical protein